MTVTLDELADDPHRHLARLRTGGAVAFVPALDAYVVTARAAALAVLRDPVSFTVDDPRFSTARVVGPSMLSLDDAAHRAHREPFVAPFRARTVEERFGPLARSVVGELLDAVVATGPPAELRTALAGPLAAAVAAAAVGLDGRDHAIVARLLGWYHEIVASVAGVTAGRPTTAAGDAAMAALTASLPPGTPASDAAVVMFGAIETTEGLILNTLWFLLGQPAELAAVRARPDLVGAAIEEALRLEPPAAQVHRYATRPVTLGGVTIEAGALVVVALSAANRDPVEFAEPDRFDLYRPNVRRHLAFAAGPHVCLGADLARLEAHAAVNGLFDRLPGLCLDEAAPSPTGLVFRKPARLPVRWGPTADAIVGG